MHTCARQSDANGISRRRSSIAQPGLLGLGFATTVYPSGIQLTATKPIEQRQGFLVLCVAQRVHRAPHQPHTVAKQSELLGAAPGANVLEIGMDITIRAANAGQAILDGEDARRVIDISSGTVVLDGLHITKGYTSSVRARIHPSRPRHAHP